MHKLLQRQLRKYRGSEEVADEWKQFIAAVDEAYIQYDEDYTMVERSLDYTSKELLQRNNELSQAFKELGETQAQLVQSSKMVALGQLISGIAHEINTPASCISGAIEEIYRDYSVLLTQLTELMKSLDPTEMQIYFDARNQLKSFEKNISTQEQRKIAREIAEFLDKKGIAEARNISKQLATIGYTNRNLDDIFSLLESPHANQIVQSLFYLGMNQIHVHDIRIAIERIIRLVKALKLYTHFDQQSYMTTNLKEDLENTLIILENKTKRAITINKEFADIPLVTCYADQLNQVWTNLINNAIEAMKGEGTITLRLKEQDKDHICVEVEDNGPGIPPAILTKIFEPYFTTKPKGEGTGLGLSISLDIVHKQQGDIQVESKPGKTLFRVILPINVPEIKEAVK